MCVLANGRGSAQGLAFGCIHPKLCDVIGVVGSDDTLYRVFLTHGINDYGLGCTAEGGITADGNTVGSDKKSITTANEFVIGFKCLECEYGLGCFLHPLVWLG